MAKPLVGSGERIGRPAFVTHRFAVTVTVPVWDDGDGSGPGPLYDGKEIERAFSRQYARERILGERHVTVDAEYLDSTQVEQEGTGDVPV